MKTWWTHGEHILWKPGENLVKTWWTLCENLVNTLWNLSTFVNTTPRTRARARAFLYYKISLKSARADPTEKSFHFFLRGHSLNKTSLVKTRWKPDGIQKASFLCNKHGTKLGELWKLGEKLLGFGHYDKLGEDQGETKVKIKGTLETKSTL